jgi:hypothetical protein
MNDFVCKNNILNILDNTQYDLYSSNKSVKALWTKMFKVKGVIMKIFKI